MERETIRLKVWRNILQSSKLERFVGKKKAPCLRGFRYFIGLSGGVLSIDL